MFSRLINRLKVCRCRFSIKISKSNSSKSKQRLNLTKWMLFKKSYKLLRTKRPQSPTRNPSSRRSWPISRIKTSRPRILPTRWALSNTLSSYRRRKILTKCFISASWSMLSTCRWCPNSTWSSYPKVAQPPRRTYRCSPVWYHQGSQSEDNSRCSTPCSSSSLGRCQGCRLVLTQWWERSNQGFNNDLNF